MHKLFLPTLNTYNGEQLSPLWSYLNHGVLGDSVVSWIGPCDVTLEHMIDGEDLREKSTIAGNKMLHLIIEIFNQDLYAGILLQRLIGELTMDLIRKTGRLEFTKDLLRKGDDIYWQGRKLNVSIATVSRNSTLLHFGINVTNDGTPVATCALSDFAIESPQTFAEALMTAITSEIESQKRAFCKVRTF